MVKIELNDQQAKNLVELLKPQVNQAMAVMDLASTIGKAMADAGKPEEVEKTANVEEIGKE